MPLRDPYSLESYNFVLPQDRIAQFPPERRGESRLLVMSKENDNIVHAMFSDLADYLPPKSLLVANNSKVLQARLEGFRDTMGKAEFLLLTPIQILLHNARSVGNSSYQCEAEGLLKMGARARKGQKFTFHTLFAEILEVGPFGRHVFLLSWKGDLLSLFATYGQIPLPPYISRSAQDCDTERYQTVYAKEEKLGSVAAPTAGLHFTESLRSSLKEKGFEWSEITLYVGYGTFSPVREEDIRKHAMHSEYIEIPEKTAASIQKAKDEGRPIIAIGTTSMRSLEGAFLAQGKIAPFTGYTDIFLYPGKSFHVCDGLITNFHLPKSTLLMLVAAFVGREKILRVYEEAIQKKYRFFSYGDAMLIR